LAHGPSAATVTNLQPNTRQRQSEKAESGLERAEASIRTGQGYSGARPQTPSDRIAVDTLPVRLAKRSREVREKMLAEVDNRSAENETATTTVASNPADSPSTTANEEAKWAELRARLARLRGDPELTMELERSKVEVASSRVMEDRPSLAQATDEEAQETQLTAELCAIPCQAVLDVSLAQGTPRGQTPSKVTGTKLRDEGRDDETQASGGGRTRLNPHAVEFGPSHRFAINKESVPLRGEQLSSTRKNERYRVGVTSAKSSTTEMSDEECNARERGVDGLELEPEGGQLAVSSAWPLVKSESSVKLTSMPEPLREQAGTEDLHLGEAVTSAKPSCDSVERFPASRGKVAVGVTPECRLWHLRVSDPSKKLLANVLLDEGVTVGSALELESTRKEVQLDTEKKARNVGGDVAVEFEEENMDDWRGKEAEPEPPPSAEDERPYDVLPVNADEATEPDTYDKNQY
jgi:hypothetical protein